MAPMLTHSLSRDTKEHIHVRKQVESHAAGSPPCSPCQMVWHVSRVEQCRHACGSCPPAVSSTHGMTPACRTGRATCPVGLRSAGVHVTLPDYYSPEQHLGMIVPKTRDGRVVFMLPWLEATIAGTTGAAPTCTVEWVWEVVQWREELAALLDGTMPAGMRGFPLAALRLHGICILAAGLVHPCNVFHGHLTPGTDLNGWARAWSPSHSVC